MKKCPRCNRNIPSDANICPYCGQEQPGYKRPVNQPKRKPPTYLYYILAILLVNIPFFLSYMFAFNSMNQDYSNEKITLSAYTESNQETIQYQYDSLQEFSKQVTNSQNYVSKIESLENQLGTLIDHNSFDKEYLFQITQNNNIYATIQYEITAKTNEIYQIDYSYDLSGNSSCNVTVINENIKSIDEMIQLINDSQNSFDEIIHVFNDKDNTKLLSATQEEFFAMKDELTQDKISHYGQGVVQNSSKQRYSIRVFEQEKGYKLKRSFDTQVNKKKFM